MSLPPVMEEENEIRGSQESCKRPVTATEGHGMGSRGDIRGKGLLSKSLSPAEDEAHKPIMGKSSMSRPWELAQTSRKSGKAASWAGLGGSLGNRATDEMTEKRKSQLMVCAVHPHGAKVR